MNRPAFAFLVSLLVGLSICSAADTRSWSGKWNNKKFGTSGPLNCEAVESSSGVWDAVFTGKFQGDPFEYRTKIKSREARGGLGLTGDSKIRGHQYQWTGSISGRQLRGTYRSNVGYYGEFVLSETTDAGRGRMAASDRRNSSPVTDLPKPSVRPSSRGLADVDAAFGIVDDAPLGPALIDDGDGVLFIGNSFMANEGGVDRYLTPALERSGIEIRAEKMISYGQPLKAMMTPKIGAGISSKVIDLVVITSGELDVMKQFQKKIDSEGKRTAVFMTWQLKHPGNKADMASYTAKTKSDIVEMRKMERETNATIIPVAVVFHSLASDPPTGMPRADFIWQPNNIHQNELGTLVNAWTVYAVLTGESPERKNYDVPPWIVGQKLQSEPGIRLTRELRQALQERVWKVVKQWRQGKTHLE